MINPQVWFVAIAIFSFLSCQYSGKSDGVNVPNLGFTDSTLVESFEFAQPPGTNSNEFKSIHAFIKNNVHYETYKNFRMSELADCLASKLNTFVQSNSPSINKVVAIFRVGSVSYQPPKTALAIIFMEDSIALIRCNSGADEFSKTIPYQQYPKVDALQTFDFVNLFRSVTDTPIHFISVWTAESDTKHYIVDCINAQDYDRDALRHYSEEEYAISSSTRSLLDSVFEIVE